MNKFFAVLVALFVSSSVLAHDDFVRRGGGYGAGGAGYYDQRSSGHHDHRGRGPSLGQVVAGAVILGAAAVIIDRAFPQQPGVVVYTAPPEVICRNAFVPVTDQFGRPLYDRYNGQPLMVERRFC